MKLTLDQELFVDNIDANVDPILQICMIFVQYSIGDLMYEYLIIYKENRYLRNYIFCI